MAMIKSFGLRASAIVLAISAMAPASVLAREVPPAPAAAKPYNLPPLTEFTLPNGMKVTMAQHGNVPKVTVIAKVLTGNIDDGENVWLSDLTSAVMEKGAAGKTASQLADAAAGMGGSLNLSTGVDASTASIDVLSEFAPQAVALVADLLQRPDFKAAELEKVRADMLRNLMIAQSTPGSIATEAFQAAAYPGHPYGRTFPTQEQLSGYTLDQVRGFYDANYGAKRTHIYIIGKFDPNVVKAAVTKAFGGWKAGPAVTNLPAPNQAPPKVILLERANAPQSTVWIGRRVARPAEDVDFRAASTLLGGYFSSRITRNIREDKGYTYSPTARLGQNKQGATWAEIADITAESTGPAISEIYKEIRRMQDTLPSAEEVRGIKNYMNGTFVMGLSSRQGLAANLANLEVQGLSKAYLTNYVSKVNALTAADFQTAAKRELPIDQLNVVVVGPLQSVRPQLEKLPELTGKLPN